jgi:hypothetical protein
LKTGRFSPPIAVHVFGNQLCVFPSTSTHTLPTISPVSSL